MEADTSEDKRNNKINEHLANERTFLAWIRTGIATVSLGFVIARFSFWLREIAISTGDSAVNPRPGLSLPIGLGMVAFGALMALFATWRYKAIRNAIDHELPHPNSQFIYATTVAVILLAVVLLIYLLITSSQL